MPIGVRRAIISFGSIVFFFFSNFKIHTRECINKAIESLKVLCYIFRHVQFSCQSTVLIGNGLKLFTKSHFNFKGLIFYYQNCSDLLWEKNVLVMGENFWNSRLKAENLQIFWYHNKNLFEQWKVWTIFGNRRHF